MKIKLELDYYFDGIEDLLDSTVISCFEEFLDIADKVCNTTTIIDSIEIIKED